jgi:hypothetical protein
MHQEQWLSSDGSHWSAELKSANCYLFVVVQPHTGSSKCRSPVGTVGHLQYPPTGAYDIGHRSLDLVFRQPCYSTGR